MAPVPQHARRAISAELRAAVVDHVFDPAVLPDPTARDASHLVGLAVHLHAPSALDSSNGFPVVSANVLARLQGRLPQLRSKNYVARDFLLEYQSRVDPGFRWRQHDLLTKRPRTSCAFRADPEILRLARAPVLLGEDLVYVDTGEPLTEPSRAADLAAQRRDALRRDAQNRGVVDRDQLRLLDYLNGLPPNRFTSVVRKRHGEAAALVAGMLHEGRLTQGSYDAAASTLSAMVAQPVPVYAPSPGGRTSRLFAHNAGLLTLRGDLAEVYRQDWGTYDIVSAQIAINAVDWEAPLMRAFLERNVGVDGAVWAAFYEAVGLDPSSAGPNTCRRVKRKLKRAVYSLLYGKKVERVRSELNAGLAFLGERRGDAFLADPLVADMIAARDRRAAEVVTAGGMVGAFGEWIPVEPGRNVASVMSERAQGVELSLLLPALDLAEEAGDRWHIVLWQHDGFDVAYRDRSRALSIDRRIRAAVNAECDRQGYPTALTSDLKSIVRPRAPRRRAADRPAKNPRTTTPNAEAHP